ncbi:MAG: pilus assembly protein PilM [Candidatus Hydrogenedentes bacterium]|nr:pilus assembly protein PilM [Candidatus Hydrogenedentota bacterium]
MAHKAYTSILQFDERLITRLRVKRSPKGVDVSAYDVQHGNWPASDGALTDAVRAFVKQHKVADDNVCTVLPRHDMTARILSLPTHSAVEVDSMVRLSAEEFVPYPAHEVVIDQSILRKTQDGSSTVLAVFAHRDVVEDHVDMLRACGIEPDHIYVSTACLAAAAQAAQLPGERAALVNLGAGGLEVLVLQQGKLLYGRGVASAQDWRNISDADSPEAQELAAEVRASLAAYRRDSEDGEAVDIVYVCSEYADCAAAADALTQITGHECQPAAFARSLFEHGAAPTPGIPLVATGAALAAQDRASLSLSLVPRSLVDARRASSFRKTAFTAGGLAAAILISAVAVFAQAYYQRATYAKELASRIGVLESIAESVETKRGQLVRLQQHLDRRGSALEMLAKLSELIPRSGVNVLRFTFSHNDTLTIQCRAESPGLAYELADALRSSGRRGEVPQFARAQGGDTREEMEQNQSVYQFEIIVPLAEEAPQDATAGDTSE